MSAYELTLMVKENFAEIQKKTDTLTRSVVTACQQMEKAMGRISGGFSSPINQTEKLNSRLKSLRLQKAIIPPGNLDDLRKINDEMQGINRELYQMANRKETAFSNWTDGIKTSVPDWVKNPYALAAKAVTTGAKNAMNFDDGMATVNANMRLEGAEFDSVKTRVRQIAKDNKTDVTQASAALNNIVTRTGELERALSILDAAMKGSRTRLADTASMADILTTTLGQTGMEGRNASDVLDTFIAAKRLGAGHFEEMAGQLPKLIGEGASAGIDYKEIAGMFSFLTGKGAGAGDASGMMSGLIKALKDNNVTDNLKGAGIDVFDASGRIRPTVEIMKELGRVTGNLTGAEKSDFLGSMGIDTDARNALNLFTSDVSKLGTTLSEVRLASNETNAAMAASQSTIQTAQELWNGLQTSLTEIGMAVMPAVNAALNVMSAAMSVVGPVIEGVAAGIGWVVDGLSDGNPLVLGLATAVGVATIAMKAQTIATAAMAAANKIVAVTTMGVKTAIQAVSKAMMSNPIGLIAGLAAGAVVGLTALIRKTNETTKATAAMNVEIANTKKESSEAFSAAMQAAEGSDERAAAIARINEKYKEYLPFVLSDKTTNEELAKALSHVNIELERKIKLKFKEQALEEAEKIKNAATQKLLERGLKGLTAEEQVLAGPKIMEAIRKFDDGEIDPREFNNEIWRAKGRNDLADKGWTFDGVFDYQKSLRKYDHKKRFVDVMYAEPAPVPPDPQAAVQAEHVTGISTAKLPVKTGKSVKSGKPAAGNPDSIPAQAASEAGKTLTKVDDVAATRRMIHSAPQAVTTVAASSPQAAIADPKPASTRARTKSAAQPETDTSRPSLMNQPSPKHPSVAVTTVPYPAPDISGKGQVGLTTHWLDPIPLPLPEVINEGNVGLTPFWTKLLPKPKVSGGNRLAIESRPEESGAGPGSTTALATRMGLMSPAKARRAAGEAALDRLVSNPSADGINTGVPITGKAIKRIAAPAELPAAVLPPPVDLTTAANGPSARTNPATAQARPETPRPSFTKFCDNLVVNIAEATNKGYDQISREIEEAINRQMLKYYEDYS